ncbi:uncharacterized protein [Paramormyrops kingsleyae]|uniref:uncharacterized protein n=1 Tax=Paramormyrops kingsleyae TaxID=1676925 RepID=UPI000CD66244|nr:uncharacterized protein LOC111846476 [Paramormyrops kingsleyae]
MGNWTMYWEEWGGCWDGAEVPGMSRKQLCGLFVLSESAPSPPQLGSLTQLRTCCQFHHHPEGSGGGWCAGQRNRSDCSYILSPGVPLEILGPMKAYQTGPPPQNNPIMFQIFYGHQDVLGLGSAGVKGQLNFAMGSSLFPDRKERGEPGTVTFSGWQEAIPTRPGRVGGELGKLVHWESPVLPVSPLDVTWKRSSRAASAMASVSSHSASEDRASGNGNWDRAAYTTAHFTSQASLFGDNNAGLLRRRCRRFDFPPRTTTCSFHIWLCRTWSN